VPGLKGKVSDMADTSTGGCKC